MTPYYQDDCVTLYHGRWQDVVEAFDARADHAICDPPYSERRLEGESKQIDLFGAVNVSP
jgi:23S rRNA G2445 N2-methylase RlmL